MKRWKRRTGETVIKKEVEKRRSSEAKRGTVKTKRRNGDWRAETERGRTGESERQIEKIETANRGTGEFAQR